MLVQLHLGGRGVHTSVDLGVSDIEILAGHLSQRGSKDLLRWSGSAGGGSLLDCKMGLEANAINLHASGLDELDDALSSVGLGAVVFEVVVVVVPAGMISRCY